MTGRSQTETKFHTILLAVMGKSPAVLTELVWALAQQTPPRLPDEIIVITTLPGANELRKTLFIQKGWSCLIEYLRTAGITGGSLPIFGPAQSCIRILASTQGQDLEDLITVADHERAADFIMSALRCYTDDPKTRVYASIAGGRKTMSAILALCMSLLARDQDKVYHILVNPPYDSPTLRPPFLFPRRDILHLDPVTGKKFPSEQARIELIDIPFVRMRGWIERECVRFPTSYTSLVAKMQTLMPDPALVPLVKINLRQGKLMVGRNLINLSASEFAVCGILLHRMKIRQPIKYWDEIAPELLSLKKERNAPLDVTWLYDFQDKSENFTPEDARKAASRIRGKIQKELDDSPLVSLLIPTLRSRGQKCYPASKIKIIGW